jgi:hypothetical protein
MFELLDRVTDLDATAALAAARDRRAAADRAEAELLAIAAHWADLYATLPDQDAAGFDGRLRIDGAERLVPLAGAGTPEVAEFAPAELGAGLGCSTYAAGLLVGNALELRHRLPRLWARVMDGRLPAWRACRIAEHTKALSPAAATYVDAQLAPVAHKIGLDRIRRGVEAAIKRHDPKLAASKERQAAAGNHGVWCSDEMTDGTCSIHIEADALDAQSFDQAIGRIAESLGTLGDSDSIDQRRAKAVGVIADRQGTLDLLADPEHGGTADATIRATKSSRRPQVVLYVHLHADAVAGGTGIARVEQLGPATLALVRQWLQRSDITLKPVVDLNSQIAVDTYETPDRLREQVLLRTPCCPFPWCNNLSRTKDIDHITPFRLHRGPDDEQAAGPPEGQTSTDNLAGLCRRHHRLKTHGGWTYTSPGPGTYLWRSPQGEHYLVDPSGTTPLGTA